MRAAIQKGFSRTQEGMEVFMISSGEQRTLQYISSRFKSTKEPSVLSILSDSKDGKHLRKGRGCEDKLSKRRR